VSSPTSPWPPIRDPKKPYPTYSSLCCARWRVDLNLVGMDVWGNGDWCNASSPLPSCGPQYSVFWPASPESTEVGLWSNNPFTLGRAGFAAWYGESGPATHNTLKRWKPDSMATKLKSLC
jgi:hypothetical protein